MLATLYAFFFDGEGSGPVDPPGPEPTPQAVGGGAKPRWVFRRAWEVDDGRKVRRFATAEDAAKAVERIADAEPVVIGLMAPPRPVQVRFDGAPVPLPRMKTAGWAEIAQRLEVAERAHKRRRQEDDELALLLLITRAWRR